MRISAGTTAGVIGAVAVVVVLVAGCNGNAKQPAASSSSPTSAASSAPASGSAQPQSGDYAKLLIKPTDIEAPMTFTASPPVANPDGKPGAAVTFSGPENSRVITDTILVFDDPAGATSALDAAKAGLGDVVKGTPKPVDVGTGGTTVDGNSPDKSKGKTVLLFTEGRAFVTLEFDAPPDLFPPPEFVTQLGQKQATAIKNGL